MLALLCVMLHLMLIFSPGVYTTHTINTIEQQNQAQIDAVENDPYLYNQVKLQYADEASRVVLRDETEN